jgi:hypothetical protein
MIFRVDPATGSRTVFENLRDLDRDDRLLETTNMAVDRSGNVLVTESRFGPNDVPALYRLDAATGARTLITVFDFASPDGKRKVYRTIDLAVENSDAILVLVGTLVLRDPFPRGPFEGPALVYRVDPLSGQQTLLTDFAQLSGIDPLTDPPIVGLAVAVEPSGDVLVAVQDVRSVETQALYRLNPTDGTPVLFSAVPRAPDGNINGISDIEVEPSGAILAVANNLGPGAGDDRLYRIDPVTGVFRELTNFSQGPFETLGFTPVALAVEASGNILVADMEGTPAAHGNGVLWQIDPVTGARSVLSNFDEGAAGTDSRNPVAVAVVPGQGASFVEFRAFDAVLDVDVRPDSNDERFNLKAAFTVGDESDGIRPHEEVVSLRIGSYAVTLPAGSFRRLGTNLFRFKGPVNGVALGITLRREGDKTYALRTRGRTAALGDLGRPVSISLTIGDDRGSTSVNFVK